MAINVTVDFQEKMVKKLILQQICALHKPNKNCKLKTVRIYVLTIGSGRYFFLFIITCPEVEEQ